MILLLDLLLVIIRSAGGAVYVEPKFLGSLRPDAKVYFPSHSATVDVSITHPSCPSYALQGSKSPLAVAKLRESIKHNKYDAQALAEGTPFTPFVMETFGGLGKEAVGFIKKISYAYSELSPIPVPLPLLLRDPSLFSYNEATL
jgi:hypothetical protein